MVARGACAVVGAAVLADRSGLLVRDVPVLRVPGTGRSGLPVRGAPALRLPIGELKLPGPSRNGLPVHGVFVRDAVALTRIICGAAPSLLMGGVAAKVLGLAWKPIDAASCFSRAMRMLAALLTASAEAVDATPVGTSASP